MKIQPWKLFFPLNKTPQDSHEIARPGGTWNVKGATENSVFFKKYPIFFGGVST